MAEFSDHLTALLRQIDQKLAALNSLRPFKPEQEDQLWQKLRLEWNYNSNHIEGNTLTYGETKLLVIFGKTTGGHEFREYSEMKAHDTAIFKVREMAQDAERPLSEADIRTLNEIILVEPFWKEAVTSEGQQTRKKIIPGEYKTTANNVRLKTGETFYFTSPEETAAQMHDLMNWYRANEDQLHPAVLAAMLHYRFVRIHPFDDGNGRVARLLMNYHLLRKGYPPIIIKSADKENYLTALQRADTGDGEAFVEYVVQQLLWSLDLAIKAGKGESVEEAGDWEKEVELLLRKAKSEKKNAHADQAGREKSLEQWLALNFPIIWSEFERCFQPFNRFFKEASCSTDVLFRGGIVADGINPHQQDWKEFVTKIIDKEFIPSIRFHYHFKGFLFPDSTGKTDLEPVTLLLAITPQSASLEDQIWIFPPILPISIEDLEPIREQAKFFKYQIEAIIQS